MTVKFYYEINFQQNNPLILRETHGALTNRLAQVHGDGR